MIPKIKINRKYSVDFDKIYAVEVTQRGTVWVRYWDNNNQKKIAIFKGNADEICYIINQVRVLREIPLISVKN